MTRKSTMVELVAELRKLPQSPEIDRIIAEALAGEFHDFKNEKYACGKVEVVRQLRETADLPRTPSLARAGLRDLAVRVINGEFDEEADEEDLAKMRQNLPRHMWPIFGLESRH